MKKLENKVNVSGSYLTFGGPTYSSDRWEAEIGSHTLEMWRGYDATADSIFKATGYREPAIDNCPVPVCQDLLEKAKKLAMKVGRRYSGDPDFCDHWYPQHFGGQTLPFIMADEDPEDTHHAKDAFGVMLRRQYNRAIEGETLMAQYTYYSEAYQMLAWAYVPDEDKFNPEELYWSDHAYCNDRPILSDLGVVIVIEPDLSMSVKLRGRDY